MRSFAAKFLPNTSESREMDKIDRKILHHVQQNNQLTHSELSELVGLSATSVQRRLTKLRADKIITADISVVDPSAVGRPLMMLVSVELARERTDIIDRFKRSVKSSAEVMSAYYVTGETDFLLIVSAKDMADYEAFTREFFYDNPDIKGFKTSVVMDMIKATFNLPMG